MIPHTLPIQRPTASLPELELKNAQKPKATPANLARQTYRELRDRGLSDVEIMAFAGEVLELVAQGVASQGAETSYDV